jgi:hypothetical protein
MFCLPTLVFFNNFCAVLLYVFMFSVPCYGVRYDFRIKTMFGSYLPPVVCRRACVLSTLFEFVCVEWCPTYIVLCFCIVCLRLVYPMLPVSLDCSLFIAPSLTFISQCYRMNIKENITEKGR